ncbi:hypothetical protein B0T20DRAFT_484212 [Sordaria brevicollis]|uniref:Uncharacterized protein n=1 Tax=Sordaria brevicollis TaxID=83679 RepID=A0AAE0U2M4_SORBR|nr:hypothetical protein B0T20DRAFT_484212 [Sordaria brevicollis]
MVRVKHSDKKPPSWKRARKPTAKETQPAKKVTTSKATVTKATKAAEADDTESWLLLPEFDQKEFKAAATEPFRVILPVPRRGTKLYAAWELIPVGKIVSDMYQFGSPPTNEELMSHAKIFAEHAIKQDAATEIEKAAKAILEDLNFTANGFGTGAYPVGQQFEGILKQGFFVGAIADILSSGAASEIVAQKVASTKGPTSKPTPKAVYAKDTISKSITILGGWPAGITGVYVT